MRYIEYLPAPPLRSIIRYYGFLDQPDTFEEAITYVTPPSLSKGLMFHYYRKSKLMVDNGVFKGNLPLGFVMPQAVKPNSWTFDKGWSILAVIFQPGMFRKVFPFSTVGLSDYFILFDDLKNKCYSEMLEQISLAPDNHARVQLLDNFFLSELRDVDTSDDYVSVFIKTLFKSSRKPIHELTRDIPMTDRHFRRHFLREIGLSPKTYQRLVRFSQAFHLLQTGRFNKLSSLAYSCGYYDQSTFIREFKQFLDTTPSAFLRQTNPFAENIHWKDRTDEYSYGMK